MCTASYSSPIVPRPFRLWTIYAALLVTVCAAGAGDWFDFAPTTLPPAAPTAIHLRGLNEPVAGQDGFVSVRDGHFVLGSGEPVRFWGVNGPSQSAATPAQLQHEAQLLARYGVNLLRIHGPLYNTEGELDQARVQRFISAADAMKREGMYVMYSIYFPLWLRPSADHPWLAGYDGQQHPFTALMFNPQFQEQYQSWWRALLLTPHPQTGRRLIDEPAVFALELQNEDSFFFWTFADAQLPVPQRRMLQARFGAWLSRRYGSPARALQVWAAPPLAEDAPAEGRIAFRPLAEMFHQKTPRDQDTIAFLLEVQRDFYVEQIRFLRELGYRGLITCSNWTTASPEILGPLEKYSYTVGDLVDRHGYFGSGAKGEFAEWSIREGHTYRDRSAYRFDREDGSPGPLFVHPSMDPKYDQLPSMLSETTWNRPNRFRSEAPLYYATYGALQGSDAIVHFAFDGSTWSVKPNFWMQPWTLMSPAMIGQFPAAALIYRQGLIRTGATMATVELGLDDLQALRGTPLPQDAALDELRLRDVTGAPASQATPALIDPLVHYVGATSVRFRAENSSSNVADLSPYLDRGAQRVRSSTNELELDYGRGLLRLDAPGAQGVSGQISSAGPIELADLSVTSQLDLGHIVVVALDGQPLVQSRRMLLQVMSEEQPTGFVAEPIEGGAKVIRSLGSDPWQVKTLNGSVRFHETMRRGLRITALDHAGRPIDERPISGDGMLELDAGTIYYLLERR